MWALRISPQTVRLKRMPELEPACNDVLSLIGNTPLVRISRIDTGPCELYVKLENQKPGRFDQRSHRAIDDRSR